jgi:glycosyltransferase involved in cell wall biosynthesis
MGKKIGIFTGYFLPHMGGVERYTNKLAIALRKIGYDLVIITTNHGNLKSWETTDNYTIYRLPVYKIAKNRYPLLKKGRVYKQLINQINKEKIDFYIINTRFYSTSLIGSRLGRHNNKPVILIEHGTGHFTVNNIVLDFFGHIYEHLFTNLVKKNVSKTFGVSQSSNAWVRHFGIKPSGVFYNAIDKNDERTAGNKYMDKYKNDEIIIVYAGRLIKEKGILNLLEAFNALETSNLNHKVRLVVAGDGKLLTAIRQTVKNSSVDILGRLCFEDIMSLYKRADIFVSPSLYPEGLPTSILEAGLMNCAVIATPQGGTKEVINSSNNNGIIVDGSVKQLIEAMTFLVNDDKTRIKMAKKLQERVRISFDWDSTAVKVDKSIKELV